MAIGKIPKINTRAFSKTPAYVLPKINSIKFSPNVKKVIAIIVNPIPRYFITIIHQSWISLWPSLNESSVKKGTNDAMINSVVVMMTTNDWFAISKSATCRGSFVIYSMRIFPALCHRFISHQQI